MNMRLFLISVAIACAIIVGDAHTKAGVTADEAVPTMELNFSQESATILSQVMAPNGGLTKHLHERFWSSVWSSMPTDQAQYFRANPDKIMREIEKVLGNQEMPLMTEFQTAIWTSVKKSAELRKTWLVPDLAALEKKVRSKFNGAPNIENSILNGRKLIRAAATGEPLKVSGRPPMAVNVEMAEQVLSGLNGSLDRARRLFNPVWNK